MAKISLLSIITRPKIVMAWKLVPFVLTLITVFLVIFAIVAPAPLHTSSGTLMKLIDTGTVPRDGVEYRAQIEYGVYSICTILPTNGAHSCSTPSTAPNFNDTLTDLGFNLPLEITMVLPPGWRLTPGALISSTVFTALSLPIFIAGIIPHLFAHGFTILRIWWKVLLKISIAFQFLGWLLYCTAALAIYASVNYGVLAFNELAQLYAGQLVVTQASEGDGFVRFWLAITLGGISMIGTVTILLTTPRGSSKANINDLWA